MSLYHITPKKLEAVAKTDFVAEKLLERNDLQRLLKQDITPLGEDLLVIAEEFGEWEDSSLRIDLLCLSRDASLVVVEIKRTKDGGHMELQALRYAAMVSGMTLEQVVAAYAKDRKITEESARSEVNEFIHHEDDTDAVLSGTIRIVLVSADFSTELTTAVLWLNRQGLDISCIRLRPYKMGSDVLIDVSPIIPLPETTDYEVRLRAKEQEKKKQMTKRKELLLKFWSQLIERSKTRTKLHTNRSPWAENWLPAAIGRAGFQLNLSITGEESKAELYITINRDPVKSKAAFDALLARRKELESAYGGPLDWQELPGKIACRICKKLDGGWEMPEEEWPQLQDKMVAELIRFEKVFKKPVQELTF